MGHGNGLRSRRRGGHRRSGSGSFADTHHQIQHALRSFEWRGGMEEGVEPCRHAAGGAGRGAAAPDGDDAGRFPPRREFPLRVVQSVENGLRDGPAGGRRGSVGQAGPAERSQPGESAPRLFRHAFDLDPLAVPAVQGAGQDFRPAARLAPKPFRHHGRGRDGEPHHRRRKGPPALLAAPSGPVGGPLGRRGADAAVEGRAHGDFHSLRGRLADPTDGRFPAKGSTGAPGTIPVPAPQNSRCAPCRSSRDSTPAWKVVSSRETRPPRRNPRWRSKPRG